jgi:beta-phosphoglucomutase-like phosphatase (HAD superfamily)
MIKLIIFDLDGVLIEAKKIHYDTLNQALLEVSNKYVITEAEHLSIYDGLKTNQKLELLTQNKGLAENTYESVWNRKQQLTIEAISKLHPDSEKIKLFKELRDSGYKLACRSEERV